MKLVTAYAEVEIPLPCGFVLNHRRWQLLLDLRSWRRRRGSWPRFGPFAIFEFWEFGPFEIRRFTVESGLT